MAQVHRNLTTDDAHDSNRFGKHKLDELDATRVAKHLVSFAPSEETLIELVAKARLSIPGLAPASEAWKVQKHNPICVMALARRSRFDPENPMGEGFIAVLPLNHIGLQMLALGTFDASKPDLRLITGPEERPAGIYMWGVYGPGPLAAGMALFMEKMSTPQYAGVNLYSRPNTEVGVRFNEVLGFKRGTNIDGIDAPNIWIFAREPEPPLYDSYIPGADKGTIGITVARNFDDLMRVAAIRNAVYIGEQKCPYNEEYDGNDLVATHLIAYLGDEPVGCLRLRFFGEFAKFERVAIRPEYRNSRVAIQLIKAGLKLCQKKGFRRVLGHAQARLTNFWMRFGFKPLVNRSSFVFSDFEYVEMMAELERDIEAISIDTDPYLLIRPEGRWHIPGILEESASRLAKARSPRKS